MTTEVRKKTAIAVSMDARDQLMSACVTISAKARVHRPLTLKDLTEILATYAAHNPDLIAEWMRRPPTEEDRMDPIPPG